VQKIRTTTISILALGLLAGSAIGVAAQDEPITEAIEVTGRAVQGKDLVVYDMVEMPGNNLGGNGFVSEQVWNTSDPRLNGTFTRTANWRFDMDTGTAIDAGAFELTNDGGSWVGSGRFYAFDALENARGAALVALDGRDGYEGLSAHVVFESVAEVNAPVRDLKGVIFPTVLPEVPEPYVAE
jgi:hypothetical protein